MKKNLAKTLAFVFAFGISTTAAWASSPSFSDVPAKHWSYAAVYKLADAGLVEGYGDGTFRGDRAMSRYEMAIVVSKLLQRYDSASAANKKIMDKLAVEFATELNSLGARVAKVEKKTNLWTVGGETRIRYSSNDNPMPGGKLRGGDQFDFRQRISFRGIINDKMVFNARVATASTPFGNMENMSSGSDLGLDLVNITIKDAIGFDTVRVGRSWMEFFSRGLMGKPFNADGILLEKRIGNANWQTWTGNLKPCGSINSRYNPLQGESSQFTSTQVEYRFSPSFVMGAGYYWSDITGDSSIYGNLNARPGTSFARSQGGDINFGYTFGDLTLMADYSSAKLENPVGLPNNHPRAFAIEITNSKAWPYMYPIVDLVNPSKPGTSAWMVSYRSIDCGATPAGLYDYSSNSPLTQYNSSSKGTDNTKGYWFVYQNVIAKNTVWSVQYQDLKIKNLAITDLPTNKLDKTFQTSLQFYY